jgi:hypothetical protein
MLRVGRIRMFGDRARRDVIGERRVALGIAVSKPRRGARA